MIGELERIEGRCEMTRSEVILGVQARGDHPGSLMA